MVRLEFMTVLKCHAETYTVRGFHNISVGLYGIILNWTVSTKRTTSADQKREKKKIHGTEQSSKWVHEPNMHFREKNPRE